MFTHVFAFSASALDSATLIYCGRAQTATIAVGIGAPEVLFAARAHDPRHLCAQQELAEESKRVWKFIVEREIEAPDRFQSIQTYR